MIWLRFIPMKKLKNQILLSSDSNTFQLHFQFYNNQMLVLSQIPTHQYLPTKWMRILALFIYILLGLNYFEHCGFAANITDRIWNQSVEINCWDTFFFFAEVRSILRNSVCIPWSQRHQFGRCNRFLLNIRSYCGFCSIYGALVKFPGIIFI